MTTIVFQDVPVAELPPVWRRKLASMHSEQVTVRIEGHDEAYAEALYGLHDSSAEPDDTTAYLRSIRTPGYNFNPTGNGD